jgi:RNase adaptor protein for sRNA GlmZ degradation
LNPGRIEEYKTQTGRDKSVQEFLLHKTSMPSFLQHVFGLIDISVEDYIKRDFEGLTISFGCTGGQHRSVFAADRLAEHLKDKYKVNTVVRHIEQDAKNWINERY